MSRIGRLPITVPAGVQVKVKDLEVHVKGPKGEMKRDFSPRVEIKLEGNQVLVTRSSDEPSMRALHGTTRALINNMVTGVSTGFTRLLDVDGVGYRPEMNGAKLVLYVGFSHPVTVEPPTGISFDVDAKARQIKVVERAIMPSELAQTQEVFVTGSAAEVTPVTQIGEHKFPVGPLTKTLMEDFDRLVRSPDKASAA